MPLGREVVSVRLENNYIPRILGFMFDTDAGASLQALLLQFAVEFVLLVLV